MSKLLPILLFAGLLFALPASAQAPERIAAYLEVLKKDPAAMERHLKRITPQLIAATVAISPENGQGSGSGVIISADGLVLTAAHVIMEADKRHKVLLADGRTVDGIALGMNHETDAGMLRITTPGTYPFRPAIEEKAYEVADWVVATGQPGGPFIGRPPVVRLGLINKAGTESGFSDPIQSTCTVISGDSGGPLFDLLGRVIGIHSNIQMPWTANQHVPLPCFRSEWQDMLDGKVVGGSGGGEDISQIDDPFKNLREKAAELDDNPEARLRPPHVYAERLDRADAKKPAHAKLGLHFDLAASNCVVAEVRPDSPAETAGIKKGDVVRKLGDTKTASLFDFVQEIQKTAPGEVELTVKRGTNLLELTVASERQPVRRLLSHPYNGALASMLKDGPATPMATSLDDARDAFVAEQPETTPYVFEVLADEDRLVMATALPMEGHVVTKHSELGKRSNLVLRVDGETHPCTLVASDDELDLALLHAPGLKGQLSYLRAKDLPSTATVLLSPFPETWRAGVITQPIRPGYKIGYDHNLQPGQTPPFLGVQFSENEDTPTVIRVEPASPADLGGIVEGDQIVRVGRKRIEKVEDVVSTLRSFQPNQKLEVLVKRGDEEMELSITLGRPDASLTQYKLRSKQTDDALKGVSQPEKLSQRRQGFPDCIYHDTLVERDEVGGPVFDTEGNWLGVTIARSYRHRTLALPAASVLAFANEHLNE